MKLKEVYLPAKETKEAKIKQKWRKFMAMRLCDNETGGKIAPLHLSHPFFFMLFVYFVGKNLSFTLIVSDCHD